MLKHSYTLMRSNLLGERCNTDRLSSSRQLGSRRQQWRRRLRYIYVRFIRMQGSPQAIARGLAAGVFAGWFPLFGLQTIIGVAIAALIRGNKIMAAAGTWVSNPFTYVPIYFFNFRIGQWLLQNVGMSFDMPAFNDLQRLITSSRLPKMSELIALGTGFTIPLFLGSFVAGLISAFLAYALGIWAAQTIRQHRKKPI